MQESGYADFPFASFNEQRRFGCVVTFGEFPFAWTQADVDAAGKPSAGNSGPGRTFGVHAGQLIQKILQILLGDNFAPGGPFLRPAL
jgi:hypothetical protein